MADSVKNPAPEILEKLKIAYEVVKCPFHELSR